MEEWFICIPGTAERGWGTGARLHSFLADTLILFQSGGEDYPHPIEWSFLLCNVPPSLHTCRYKYNSLVFAKSPKESWAAFWPTSQFQEELFFRVDHSSMKLAFLLRPDFSKQPKESCKNGSARGKNATLFPLWKDCQSYKLNSQELKVHWFQLSYLSYLTSNFKVIYFSDRNTGKFHSILQW